MAVFDSYPVNQSSYSYVPTLYRAVGSGVGYTEGDILRETAQINNAQGNYTGISVWYNVDTDSVIAAPASEQVEALDAQRITLTAEKLIVSSVSPGYQFAAVPANANYAEVHVWAQDITFTLNGVEPTPSTGFRQANGQTFKLESRSEITGFMAKRYGATDAALWVQYYRVFSGQ